MNYAGRVKQSKKFIHKNKLFMFIVLALFILGYLGGNDFAQDKLPEEPETMQSQTEDQPEETTLHWRFYWSDVGILVVAGGFCTIMIIRERKKERDNLQ